MKKEQVDERFFWEIKDFYESGKTPDALAHLLLVLYLTGYNDGRMDND